METENGHIINQEPENVLLLKYIRGMASETESEQVRDWLAADTENEQTLLQIARLYYACRTRERILARDPLPAYRKVQKRIKRQVRILWLKRSVAAAACYAALFPRLLTGAEISVKYELLSGSLLFCACFMAADPCTTPRTSIGKCLYGALAGILLMLLRNYGAYEQGGCFAILLMGAVGPLLDRAVLYFRRGGAVHANHTRPDHSQR